MTKFQIVSSQRRPRRRTYRFNVEVHHIGHVGRYFRQKSPETEIVTALGE